MCTDIIDNKIFELQKAANRHIDPLAIWTIVKLHILSIKNLCIIPLLTI